MSLFTWKSEYGVGCPEIDGQHERLFHMADELHRAMLERRGEESLSGILKRLLDYTEYHFMTEERLMRENAYPAYLQHRLEHDALTRQVHAFRDGPRGGEPAATVHLLNFLSDWLKQHIGESDRKLGAHLAARQRAQNLVVPCSRAI